jgi:hypothetical protein
MAHTKTKGHWRKGRRRNDPGPEWRQIRTTLARLLYYHAKPKVISLRAAAAHVGVDPRTMSRWLDGTDFPSPDSTQLIKGFLRKHDHLRAKKR